MQLSWIILPTFQPMLRKITVSIHKIELQSGNVCNIAVVRLPLICCTMKRICRFYVYRPKRSFGQGNIFTSVCQEFCSRGGGVWSDPGGVSAPNFRGGVCSKFSLQIFGGWGGCLLQIFGGGRVSAPNFWGGVSAPNFRGGVCSKSSGRVSAPNFQGGVCSKFSGG